MVRNSLRVVTRKVEMKHMFANHVCEPLKHAAEFIILNHPESSWIILDPQTSAATVLRRDASKIEHMEERNCRNLKELLVFVYSHQTSEIDSSISSKL